MSEAVGQRAEESSAAYLAMTRLLEVGDLCIRSGNDFGVCLDAILEAAIFLTAAAKGTLQLIEGDKLSIAASRGFKKPFLEIFAQDQAFGGTACGALLRCGKRVIIEDIERSEVFTATPALAVLRESGVRAVQSTPLISTGGCVTGVISTHFDQRHTPNLHELRLLDLLARQAADYLERKATDQMLREREWELRQTLDTAGTGLVRCSRDLHILSANPAYARIVGLPLQQIVGRSIAEVIGAGGLERILPHVERVLRGERVEYEVEIPFAGSGPRHLHIVYTPWRVLDEQVTGWVASLSDISECKRAQEALRMQTTLLKAVSDSTPEAIYVKDRDGRCLFANPAAVRMFDAPEFAETNIVGKTKAETLLDADLVRRISEIDRQVMETGIPRIVDDVLQGPLGRRYLRVTKAPLRNQNGTIIGLVGISHDVTKRKRAEEQLRRSEARARAQAAEIEAIYAAAPVGLCVLDPSLRFMRINDRIAEINGVPAAAHIGRSVAEIVPDLGETAEATLRRVIAGEAVRDVEFVGTTPAQPGVIRTFRSNSVPLRDPQGNIVGAIFSAEEVTQEKAAEEALRVANRQKDEFLAMLSHELRNPLAPIRNAGTLLQRQLADDPRVRAPLAIIERQTQQLVRLIDDLLDVSRISMGRIALRHEPLEIGPIIEQAVEAVEPTIAANSQQLRVVISGGPCYVQGDRARLVQSLSNLLQNATKYTDLGGKIALAVTAAEGHVEFEVRDTGQGISEELLPHVFDVFVQGEQTVDRSHGGLGLGLTITRRLVEMHGGTVEAASEGLGRGSRFTIRLPRVTAPSAGADESAGPKALRRRVLVVDDNADAANSLAMLLRSEGHEVDTAYDSAEALRVAERSDPEIILLDIGLPQMDGYEVARHVRARHGRGVRLVALTGYGQAEDRSRALAAGFDGYLVKPTDLEALERLLAS